ncbi:MAG: septum formation initiator family protein [Actinomycetota bacterium]|nr:septum formation initiator family protein [Actinomycetota bacterium]
MRRAAWPFIVSVIVVGVLFLAVFPTRTYVQQRGKLAATEERLEVLSAQNERLAARVRKLNTDAEIERLSREQYSLVRPGEEAYAILPAPSTEAPSEKPAPDKRDDPGFWGGLWDDITFWS